MYEVDIKIYFNYNGTTLGFNKNIELPFIPYYGLSIIFDDEKEYELKLKNADDYDYNTEISYSINKKRFEILIHESCNYQIDIENINYILKKFSDWKKLHKLEDEEKIIKSI